MHACQAMAATDPCRRYQASSDILKKSCAVRGGAHGRSLAA